MEATELYAVINQLPDQLRNRADYIDTMVWEKVVARPRGSGFIDPGTVREIVLIIVVSMLLEYLLDGTQRALSSLASIKSLGESEGVIGFSVGNGEFADESEETFRGRVLASHL